MQTYKSVVFDFDSTLIRGESLDMLAAIALSGHHERAKILADLEAITQQGMNGEISFDESLGRRLQLFKANKEHVTRLVERLVHEISPSVQRYCAWFLANRDRIYVVSGGFVDYIEPVASSLGIRADHVFANRFIYDDSGIITGFEPDSHLCRAGGKVSQLAALGLARPLVMIGDGYTDYEVKAHGEADAFWALTENVNRHTITAKADRVLEDFAEAVR